MAKKNAAGTPPVAEWTDPDDAPELTEEFFADAEVFNGNTFVRRGRGRPPTGNAKEQVSIRLDQDVLAKLRAAGPGWQSGVNGMLRAALGLGQTDATEALAEVFKSGIDALSGAGSANPPRVRKERRQTVKQGAAAAR